MNDEPEKKTLSMKEAARRMRIAAGPASAELAEYSIPEIQAEIRRRKAKAANDLRSSQRMAKKVRRKRK